MADGTAKKITSGDVRAALKLRYPAQSHALLFEVAPTTGGGTRYADAVAVGLWASHGHAIEGIEIKVSRADFLSEMKQPEKSQPVFQYCHRWWLACPKDMVRPEELPETWGLLELCGDTLRQKVKAPKLEPVPITLGFLGALIRRHAGLDEEMASAEIGRRLTAHEKEITDRLERRYKDDYNRRVKAAEEGMQIIAKIKETTGLDLASYECRDGALLSAVKLAIAMDKSYGGISDLRRSANRLVESIDASGLIPTPTPEGGG
jgi:hypothetical protein